MPCNWIELEGGGYAHVNGDMSNPETAEAIRAVCAAALKRFTDQEDTEDDRSTA